MAVRKVLQLGDPKLKLKCNEISEFISPDTSFLKDLIKDLQDTMYEQNIVGISAPQIGENVKVFVTEARQTNARPNAQTDEFRVYINPEIISFSKEQVIIYEGCGSVMEKNLFGPVERPREITIQAYNEFGKKFQLRCDGLLARIIQHEYDHLFGIEFTEKIYDYKLLLSREFYMNSVRDSKENVENSIITVKEYKSMQ